MQIWFLVEKHFRFQVTFHFGKHAISLHGAIYPSLLNCVKTSKYRREKHQRATRSRRHVNLRALQNSTDCFEMPYK